MPDRIGVIVQMPILGRWVDLIPENAEIHRLWEIDDLPEFAQSDAGQRVEMMLAVGMYPVAATIIDALPNLRAIVCVGAGHEGIDLAHCAARGIEVANSPGANADDVADTAVTMLLALTRGLGEADAFVRSGRWTSTDRGTPQRSITEYRIGIVGLGAIGSTVARRLEAFDCDIGWYGPNPKQVAYPRAASLTALADESDALVLCCAASATNRNMIDAGIIERLGPEGVIVNVGRGSLIEEDALRDALKNGRLRGAGLDVFEAEPTPARLWQDVPNVMLSAHAAATTRRSTEALRAMVRDNFRSYFDTRRVRTPVAQR